MSNAPSQEEVLSVEHIPTACSNYLHAAAKFRFRSGEFIMIGLPGENGKPLLRAIVWPAQLGRTLEFYSIKVATAR